MLPTTSSFVTMFEIQICLQDYVLKCRLPSVKMKQS